MSALELLQAAKSNGIHFKLVAPGRVEAEGEAVASFAEDLQNNCAAIIALVEEFDDTSPAVRAAESMLASIAIHKA